MTITERELRYEADGLEMHGFLVQPDQAHGPAVLVFPEAFGLGEHAKRRARRLADEFGYIALACDLHGEGKSFATLPEVMPTIELLSSNANRVRARTRETLATLISQPGVDPSRVAAIGFCFGGTMAFELALTGAELRAAIGFHSGLALTSPGDAGAIRGKVLAMIGADDPFIPAEQRTGFEAMMRAGNVDWQLHQFGGVVHSFTAIDASSRGMPDILRYDADADARSWSMMAALLAEVFALDAP